MNLLFVGSSVIGRCRYYPCDRDPSAGWLNAVSAINLSSSSAGKISTEAAVTTQVLSTLSMALNFATASHNGSASAADIADMRAARSHVVSTLHTLVNSTFIWKVHYTF